MEENTCEAILRHVNGQSPLHVPCSTSCKRAVPIARAVLNRKGRVNLPCQACYSARGIATVHFKQPNADVRQHLDVLPVGQPTAWDPYGQAAPPECLDLVREEFKGGRGRVCFEGREFLRVKGEFVLGLVSVVKREEELVAATREEICPRHRG